MLPTNIMLLFFSLQDDRNQMITTNVWVRQVSTL